MEKETPWVEISVMDIMGKQSYSICSTQDSEIPDLGASSSARQAGETGRFVSLRCKSWV